MSTNLYWKPVDKKRHNAGKDSALKWAMQKRFNYPIRVVLDDKHYLYFKGLNDAGIDGAQELIDAIEKYGEIEVFEE